MDEFAEAERKTVREVVEHVASLGLGREDAPLNELCEMFGNIGL